MSTPDHPSLPFFIHLPALADHSTCGGCRRRRRPRKLSYEWLDTACKRGGWAWE
uniref:Uncharacterized protein n=1 Tax=Zea mays TaxID=4577 RepID=B6SJ71_MAIZE|nr:hypothetical protein [Zea mays]